MTRTITITLPETRGLVVDVSTDEGSRHLEFTNAQAQQLGLYAGLGRLMASVLLGSLTDTAPHTPDLSA